ncbi:class I SAM-dependent methyltransferase [Streptomyces sp. NPDC002867]
MDVMTLDRAAVAPKMYGVVGAYPRIWHGNVVDIGCRTRDLEQALKLKGHEVHYIGVDVDPDAEVVADLGKQLPFDDDYANVITAFDVLEHTDDIHHAFSELCRVAREHIVITLPNCYEVRIRVRHLRGKPISGKYGLPTVAPKDRHRWFFSLDEARVFVREASREQGWEVADERALAGPGNELVRSAVHRWPNLLSPTYLALLRPSGSLGA